MGNERFEHFGYQLHFSRVLSGEFPSRPPCYKIGSAEVTWYYYITDGLYPLWKIFAKALADATDEKAKLLNSNVEAVRKCVERVFGVLYRRFKMLYTTYEFWTVSKMKLLMTAAVVIQNMIVLKRRYNYKSDGKAGRSVYNESNDLLNEIVFTGSLPGSTPLFSQTDVKVRDDIKVKCLHRDLLRGFIEHQWDAFGKNKNIFLSKLN